MIGEKYLGVLSTSSTKAYVIFKFINVIIARLNSEYSTRPSSLSVRLV